ncbi:hypothetical protein KGY79_09875 [Candidatus Bipolaricaulota bacterium]|nr:hypothetical protein [Candidatus Bipolaricaulota bacterium]
MTIANNDGAEPEGWLCAVACTAACLAGCVGDGPGPADVIVSVAAHVAINEE